MHSFYGIPDFRFQYLKHCDVNQYLECVQLKFPKLATVTTVGFSFEGRPMKSIRISATDLRTSKSRSNIKQRVVNCKSAKVKSATASHIRQSSAPRCTKKTNETHKSIILIDGGIHAREWCTVSTALYCVEQLTEHYDVNKHLLERFDFFIIPIVNVDGYEYSRMNVSVFW